MVQPLDKNLRSPALQIQHNPIQRYPFTVHLVHTYTSNPTNSQSITIFQIFLFLPDTEKDPQFRFYVHNGILPWSPRNYTLMVVGLQPLTMTPFCAHIASDHVHISDGMDSRNCRRCSKRAGRCKCCLNRARRR